MSPGRIFLLELCPLITLNEIKVAKTPFREVHKIFTFEDFCLACDEVAKARHRCYFPAATAALVFLKALYL